MTLQCQICYILIEMETKFIKEIQELKKVKRFEGSGIIGDSTADHCFGMIAICHELMKAYKLDLNYEKVLKLICAHDMGEIGLTSDYNACVVVGDKSLKAEKDLYEQQIIDYLALRFNKGELADLVEEYNFKMSKEARFVKVVDKIEAIFYIMQQGVELKKNPDFTIMSLEEYIKGFPEILPFVLEIRDVLKKEYDNLTDKGHIERKEAYDAVFNPINEEEVDKEYCRFEDKSQIRWKPEYDAIFTPFAKAISQGVEITPLVPYFLNLMELKNVKRMMNRDKETVSRRYDGHEDTVAEHIFSTIFMGIELKNELNIDIDLNRFVDIAINSNLSQTRANSAFTMRELCTKSHLAEIKYDSEISIINMHALNLDRSDLVNTYYDAKYNYSKEAKFFNAVSSMETSIQNMEIDLDNEADRDIIATGYYKPLSRCKELIPFAEDLKEDLRDHYQLQGFEWKEEYEKKLPKAKKSIFAMVVNGVSKLEQMAERMK